VRAAAVAAGLIFTSGLFTRDFMPPHRPGEETVRPLCVAHVDAFKGVGGGAASHKSRGE
jgi:hypothetical protein